METKECNKCGVEKSVERFRKSNRHSDGYNGICKDCINIRSNEIYHNIKNGTHKRKRNYECDENFFSEINSEEKSYWLGFLYADGYVRIRRGSNEIKLKLAIKDKCHIENFKKSIKSNSEIKESVDRLINKNKTYTSYSASLSIYNRKLVNDLITIGCVNNKTFKIRLPVLSDNMMSHFIRGYFDGDGCISKIKNRHTYRVQIASNNEFINDIHKHLNFGYIRNYKNRKWSILDIHKTDELLKLKHYLYNNATIYLERKKEIFDNVDVIKKRNYDLFNYKRKFLITSPNNDILITNNMVKFCRDNMLKVSTFKNLISGKSKQSKDGWKCQKIN